MLLQVHVSALMMFQDAPQFDLLSMWGAMQWPARAAALIAVAAFVYWLRRPHRARSQTRDVQA